MSGIVATLRKLFGEGPFGQFMLYTIGTLTLLTFIANMATWIMGSGRAAMEAAQAGELPEIVGKEHPKHGTPAGANLITGIVSTVVILLYGLSSGESDQLFWSVFAFSSCILLFPYLLMFPAHIKLRMTDGDRERPYKVPGGLMAQIAMSAICFLFIAQAVVLFIFPDVASATVDWSYSGPVLIGIIATVATGEWIMKNAYKRLDPITA